MFAEILLTQKVGKSGDTLTYKVPDDLDLRRGLIVEVPLRQRQVKGVVFSLHDKTPLYATRPVSRIVENAPHLEQWQLQLMEWIADYYFCPASRALKLFLPVPFVKKKKITEWMPEVQSPYELKKRHDLTEEQKDVLHQIEKSSKAVALLYGITGSGKTEIYMHLADRHIHDGKQVLMLIPEISLTPQTVERFQDHFDHRVAVIHSQQTQKEKEKAWQAIHKGEAKVVIGSRSAIFAPFKNLGTIILDEEHDTSYKQDQSPRYNALDVAQKIAEILNIKVLIGSATPSLQSYYRALEGEYDLCTLTERPGKVKRSLPKAKIVDLREEIKKKNFSIFSEDLQKKIEEVLKKKEQVILFLNRRGAASAVICRMCGYVAKCDRCEVPMTYHKKLTLEEGIYAAERLVCHHCGKIEKVPTLCPVCKSPAIRYIGLGTQRVEEDLQKLFPTARVLRADRDTTQKRGQF
ncbi:MAG TPA: primosomal protein N', partial [Candidatus Gracilibacteria bacterium]|nr:primosomal protein N' [Candidatus Gracilibacteria bacterium]